MSSWPEEIDFHHLNDSINLFIHQFISVRHLSFAVVFFFNSKIRSCKGGEERTPGGRTCALTALQSAA